MARLPGDPGPWRWLQHAAGFRLPAGYRDWVWHDLTDAGWRGRLVGRHLVLMVPICAALAMLPGEWWIRALVVLLALLASTFTVAVSAGDLRDARLRRYGMRPPDRGRREDLQ